MILVSCTTNTSTEISDNDTVISDQVVIDDTILITENDNAPEFQYESKGFENISFGAYVQDPDKKNPTNIRKSPGGEVLVALEPNNDYGVDIIGQKNAWFKINMVDVFDTDAVDIPGQIGWMHSSVLAVRTRNYGGQKLNVYSFPDKTSEVVGVIKEEIEVRFTKIYKDFVLIRFFDNKGKLIEGWIESEWLCGNPVTNCC